MRPATRPGVCPRVARTGRGLWSARSIRERVRDHAPAGRRRAPRVASQSSGHTAGSKAFEVEFRRATRQEVGDDAGGAAGHGPSRVAVADVEEEIAVAVSLGDAAHRGSRLAMISRITSDDPEAMVHSRTLRKKPSTGNSRM